MNVTYICGKCGSDDVRRDSWAEWSTENQSWELAEVFDVAHCNDCDGQCRLVKKHLEPPDAELPEFCFAANWSENRIVTVSKGIGGFRMTDVVGTGDADALEELMEKLNAQIGVDQDQAYRLVASSMRADGVPAATARARLRHLSKD